MADFSALEGALLQTMTMATPLILTSLGENLSQKSGVINVGLEGMMLCGAFAATLGAYWTGSAYIGVVGACLAGMGMAYLFSIFAIRMAASQVVIGVIINLLAIGLTGTIYQKLFGQQGTTLITARLPYVFLGQTPLFLFAIAATLGLWWWLYRTRAGLELRACGEQPVAAESAGVSIACLRTKAVLFGGLMAGLAGASLSIGSSNTFVPQMTDGRGFIALAIVTAGRWNPFGCLLAALVFGFADALQYRGQSLGLNIPKDILLALPYIATLLILSFGAAGRQGPAFLGRPYRKA